VKHTLACLDFKALAKNTLVGFARIRVNELKLVIHDVTLHRRGEAHWASLPAKPQIKDGAVVIDPDTGKAAYLPVLEFEDRSARDAFSHAVWEAVLERYPSLAEPVA
jgi:hypothetical protein